MYVTLSSLYLSDPPPPESPIASQLLEAIRAKEPTERLGEILDSLSSINPDSEFLDDHSNSIIINFLSLTRSTVSTAVCFYSGEKLGSR
jgi:NADH:ubiquinone oxidoreductase subunit E